MRWFSSFLFCTLLSFNLFSHANEAQIININTATIEQLIQLNGIGKAKAEAIIKYRQDVGKFTSLEEFGNVKGIGKSLFQKNKNRISIEEPKGE